jgi:hypothetical protein
MMKRVFLWIIVFAFPVFVMGQVKKYEYAPKVKNKIEIKNLLGEISLQNATGNVLVIESDFNMERPERAEGLKLLGTLEDNTGLGINVSEENGIVSIQGITRQVRDHQYKISVPVGIAVSLDYNSPFANDDIAVDSYRGSLEVNTLSANVKLTNSSGPFAINSVSGNVEVSFSQINQNQPTSLASVSGLIDVSVPAAEKVTFEISTITGNVYNNLDLKSLSANDKDKRADNLKAVKQSGDSTYTLNGGGQKVYLKAISGNIYLRKR